MLGTVFMLGCIATSPNRATFLSNTLQGSREGDRAVRLRQAGAARQHNKLPSYDDIVCNYIHSIDNEVIVHANTLEVRIKFINLRTDHKNRMKPSLAVWLQVNAFLPY